MKETGKSYLLEIGFDYFNITAVEKVAIFANKYRRIIVSYFYSPSSTVFQRHFVQSKLMVIMPLPTTLGSVPL
mgnify:CR=1 FL=1